MVGETLEQHCEIRVQPSPGHCVSYSLLREGQRRAHRQQGDYIFRDLDESGTEIVSIMFEMKNESDETATKEEGMKTSLRSWTRIESKKAANMRCLVSLLEPDNELYNAGIVDVFHRYPKMYVVRPQFFIPIITLLRNAAMEIAPVQIGAGAGEGIEYRHHQLRDSTRRFQDHIRSQLASRFRGL